MTNENTREELLPTVVTDGHVSAHIIGLSGDHISQILHSTGAFYERDLLGLLGSLPIEEDRLIVDVGANIGNHTIFAALTLPNPVLAIEPHPINHFLLTENIRRNGLDERVAIFHGCAWDHSGTVSLDQQHSGNMGSFHAKDSDTGDALPAVPLDDLVGDQPVGLIKIDVEGNELRVLRGATRTLARHHPLLFVEAHGPSARRDTLGLLGQLGYIPLQVAGLSETYLFGHAKSPVLMPLEGISVFARLLHERSLGL